MAKHYTLNCRQYVLMDGSKPIGRVLDAISICLNSEEGFLCKYGEPDTVAPWFEKELAKLRASGWTEMADALVVVTGRFPLDELNRCIANPGYAGEFYRKLLRGEIVELLLFDEG